MRTSDKVEEAIAEAVLRGGKPACVILTRSQLDEVCEEYAQGTRGALDLNKPLALRFCGLPVATVDDGYAGPLVAVHDAEVLS